MAVPWRCWLVTTSTTSDRSGSGNNWRRTQRRPLRVWAAELVEQLLWRSQRIAMLKMDLSNPNAPRLPAQVIERDGIWSQQLGAGDGEPGMRIPRLISMLTGLEPSVRWPHLVAHQRRGAVSVSPDGLGPLPLLAETWPLRELLILDYNANLGFLSGPGWPKPGPGRSASPSSPMPTWSMPITRPPASPGVPT